MNLKNYIQDVPDFPKKGVVFKDITPLLKDNKAFKETAKQLATMVGDKAIDKVVGMESRGFIFAPILAEKLGAGFVPVRKPGKLPSPSISETFQLEYGTETLQMHADAIQKGDRVLIHDDVLATGGTASAVINLVERLGGQIVQLNFLIELQFLEGRDKISSYEVRSLLTY